jgi:arylsulfatase A-like enzyme
MDVGPTLVELAGGTLEGRSYARSLAPVLEDPAREHRTEALSEIRGEIMIASADWKLALNRAGRAYLLFDLRSDPSETRNLAGSPGVSTIEETMRLRALERLVSSLQ